MNHALNVELDLIDGAIVRVLGVTERRGWSATGVLAQPCMETQAMNLTLNVLGSRSVELLVRQLDKLHVVRKVEVAS